MTTLHYEPITEAHAEAFFDIWCDAETIRYTNLVAPNTLEQVKEKIRVYMPHDVFVVQDGVEVLGFVGCLCMDAEKADYGFFYQLKRSVWGQGYGTEVAAWMVDFMCQKHTHLTLYADVVADNVASEAILRRLGFTPTKIETGVIHKGKTITLHHFQLER